MFIKKLKDFRLDLSDIVGTTTDGAAVMVKFGSLLDSHHQQCLNHGIHLAIMDVLFKRVNIADTVYKSDENNDEIENDEASDISNDEDDLDDVFKFEFELRDVTDDFRPDIKVID